VDNLKWFSVCFHDGYGYSGKGIRSRHWHVWKSDLGIGRPENLQGGTTELNNNYRFADERRRAE
jgi:hypothetical protein